MSAVVDRRDRVVSPKTFADGSYPPVNQAVGILAVLFVATTFAYIDRAILGLLVAPIQHDMKVNDLQMSLLLGPTFALFYAVMGLPLGWAADRGRRLLVAAVGVAVWSLATVLSGLSHEFWHLFVARIFVASGEAALLPSASSLVIDSFRPAVRTRMMGVLGMAIYWGSGLAFLFGGLLISLIGHLIGPNGYGGIVTWQFVLMSVGAPGFLVAIALALLPEPARASPPALTAAPRTPRGGAPQPQLTTAVEYSCLFIAIGMMAIVGYSLSSWTPTHLIRAYHWSAGQAGIALGIGFVLTTTLAIWLASSIADRLAAQGRRDAKYLVMGCCTLAAVPLVLAIGLVQDARVFVAATSLAMGASAACIAMGPAAVCQISIAQRRGRAVGLYQMTVGLIGGALGAPAVALIAKFSTGASGGLAVALCTVATFGFVVAAALFWSRRRAFARTSLAISGLDPG